MMCSLRFFAVAVVLMYGTALPRAACVGTGECPDQDKSDSYLAKNSRYRTGDSVVSEDTGEFGDPIKAIVQKANSADDSSPKLLELESDLEKLVTTNATYTATSPEVEALKVVAGYVAQVITATEKGHAENQKELNDALQLAKDCNSAAKIGADGRLTTQAGVVSSAKTTHHSCRVAEVSLKDTRDEKCKSFSDRKESFGLSRASGLGMCSSGSADPTDDAITDGFNWLDDLKTKMDACNSATTTHDDKRSECGTNQSNYEKSRCFFKDKTEEVCNELDSCYRTHSSFVTTRGQAVRTMEAVRKAEHVSAKRVLCYIEILSNNTGNKTEKLQTCRGSVSTSHLSIVYPEVPNKYNCVRIATYPCGDDWVRAEYTTQTWYAKANTKACSECLTSPPTPAPTPNGPPSSFAQYRWAPVHERTGGDCVKVRHGHQRCIRWCFSYVGVRDSNGKVDPESDNFLCDNGLTEYYKNNDDLMLRDEEYPHRTRMGHYCSGCGSNANQAYMAQESEFNNRECTKPGVTVGAYVQMNYAAPFEIESYKASSYDLVGSKDPFLLTFWGFDGSAWHCLDFQKAKTTGWSDGPGWPKEDVRQKSAWVGCGEVDTEIMDEITSAWKNPAGCKAANRHPDDSSVQYTY